MEEKPTVTRKLWKITGQRRPLCILSVWPWKGHRNVSNLCLWIINSYLQGCCFIQGNHVCVQHALFSGTTHPRSVPSFVCSAGDLTQTDLLGGLLLRPDPASWLEQEGCAESGNRRVMQPGHVMKLWGDRSGGQNSLRGKWRGGELKSWVRVTERTSCEQHWAALRNWLTIPGENPVLENFLVTSSSDVNAAGLWWPPLWQRKKVLDQSRTKFSTDMNFNKGPNWAELWTLTCSCFLNQQAIYQTLKNVME